MLIIYKGSKEDLPELFKNIYTGSVALSQYEVLQSVWNDYILDSSLIQDTREAFGRELDLIQNEYEINAIKEAGSFDIFKNVPYATGKKRYLINHTKHHINGDMFLAPIKVGGYFIETHKSRSGALRDVYNYMKHIGVDAEYIE